MKPLRLIAANVFCSLCFVCAPVSAGLPDLDESIVKDKLAQIMEHHVSHKQLDPEIVRRTLINYVELEDPVKTYFIEADVDQWLEPADSLVQQLLRDFEQGDFSVFYEMHDAMAKAIQRRQQFERRLARDTLPKDVNPKEFKDLNWAKTEDELYTRLLRLRSLQLETAEKLDDPELREVSIQRIEKRRLKYEEDYSSNGDERKKQVLANILKASASALDSQTAYFTPDEAEQFMINVQQRLFGIGAQLRDDLNGFTIVRVVEGGPAERAGTLHAKDRIIAVNGEPVVGMDILEAVELIRGEENTPVELKIVRTLEEEGKTATEQTLDVTIERGEVVLKEARIETDIEPFGDGVIAFLHLYSFYQDPDDSSTSDMIKEFSEIQKEHKVKGVVLDLRNNSGGMLSQAVGVTGLFMTKGIVCSIKNEKGQLQHLRDLDSKTIWDGPLVVLVNRASASAAEIVTQTLQDYGRAVIVGDDRTFGKGTFQTFTLASNRTGKPNPEGEYKVTRGRYYTVSGRSPQLVGVATDIVVPGPFSEIDVGEAFTKFPLQTDTITANYDDDLSDVPRSQREKVRRLYKFDLQPRLTHYAQHIEALKKNSAMRIEKDKNYQTFLAELKKESDDDDEEPDFGQNDLQKIEAFNIMKDLILLLS